MPRRTALRFGPSSRWRSRRSPTATPASPPMPRPSSPASWPPMARRPGTIDEYLAALSEDKRAALETLRKTIRAAAPQAEECVSYQIAAFRLNGMLVGFGATASHCAFYLMSATTVAAPEAELRG